MINFDAIYRKRHRSRSLRHLNDVSLIIQDFSIHSCQVLCMCSANLDINELKERENHQIIYDPAVSTKKKYLLYSSPVCSENPPVSVLVPHIRLDEKRSFIEFSVFLLRINSFSSDFFRVFHEQKSLKTLNCKIPEDPINMLSESSQPNNSYDCRFIIYVPLLLQNVKKISIFLSHKLNS